MTIVLIPAFASANAVDLSGTMRLRYESLSDHFRSGRAGGDQQLATQGTLRIDASGGRWDGVAEVMDSRAFLTDDGSHVDLGMVNALEMIQANVRYTTESGNTKVTAGRYTLNLANRRLVGRNRFRNTTTSFVGVLAEFAPNDDRNWTFIYNYPSRIQPSSGAALRQRERAQDDFSSDLVLWGGHLTDRRSLQNHHLETYLLVLDEEDAPDYASVNRQLTTFGARVIRPPMDNGVDYQVEFMVQSGDRRASGSATDNVDLDVSAFLFSAQVGFSGKAGHRIQFAFDVVSGDDTPGDLGYERFDTLVGPSVPDFGFTGIYGATSRANVVSPEVRYSFREGRFDGYAAYRPVWLHSDRDSYGRSGVRDPAGQSGSFVGHQLTGQVRYWIVKDRVRLETGAGLLKQGEFLETAPNTARNGDTLYAFSALTASF